jgi:pimeloyl-ACP methyl ester carboxylesterase
VLAPVFYGVRDVGTAEGAPGPVRVFFPSLDGAVFDAPIEGLAVPTVIFATGIVLGRGHYKKRFESRRAGAIEYVAVCPAPRSGRGAHPRERGTWRCSSACRWIDRMGHRAVLLPEPATGVVGHSFGALLAGRFAASANVGAYASLSGVWQDWPDSNRPIQSLRIPKLFTWGDDLLDLFSSLDSGGLWDTIPVTKHKAVFAGAAHWDYLRAGRTACASARGDCDLVRLVASDLLCTFFGKTTES